MNPSIELELRYGASNYEPLPVTLTRGEGVFLWDDEGKRYFDLMSAYSAVSFGHCHPKVVEALREQAGRLGVISRAFYNDKLGPFLERACELTGMDKALPMNSGAEAVETALKAARKWAYTVKGIRPNKAEIISCEGNFHGRTLAIISMSSEAQYQNGFGPFLPGLRTIHYGKAQALEMAITHNTAAFIVEPIQGEGGIIVPPPGYLKACAELCKKNKVLFLCDEIQTGLGRTGKMLACEHEGVRPDGVMLGKALGGGLLPVSLFLARKEVMNVFHPGDHGSTFGGNPLAAAVGSAALEILVNENLCSQAADQGQYFIDALRALSSPVIKAVRGKGLLIGLEINAQFSAREVCLALLRHGVLTKETHKTVVRLAPPLIITQAQIDEVLTLIKAALEEIKPTEEEATDVEVTLPKRVEDLPVEKPKRKPRVRKAAAPQAAVKVAELSAAVPVETVAPSPEVEGAQAPVEVPTAEVKAVELSAAVPVETVAPSSEVEGAQAPVEVPTAEMKAAEPSAAVPVETVAPSPKVEGAQAPVEVPAAEVRATEPSAADPEETVIPTLEVQVAPGPVKVLVTEVTIVEPLVDVAVETRVASPASDGGAVQAPTEPQAQASTDTSVETPSPAAAAPEPASVAVAAQFPETPAETEKKVEQKAGMSQGNEEQTGTDTQKGE